ncbi:MAG: IclR family transcriptional regulator [Alphaproteobacteria bacterium]
MKLATPKASEIDAGEFGGSPIVKALALLEGVAGSTKPIALSDLVSLLGLPKPTVHRIALLLEREGFLQREPGSRRFVVGYRLVSLGLQAAAASVAEGPTHAILKTLSEQIGESTGFGVMARGEVVCLDKVETSSSFGLRVAPKTRLPLHCSAVGKLFLAHMPPRERERLVRSLSLDRFTERTITNADELLDNLRRVRAKGFAVNDQEHNAGVVCVAVPVMGIRRRMCAGLAIGAPVARLSLDQAIEHVPAMQRSAAHLSEYFSAVESIPRGMAPRTAAE